ncbi:MAG: type II toxin-antitoxin system YafQ family toxin [Pseudomonadota bacterium]|nr:type II toxin-antitoxin system YafQ family toxin [Pseudomonadota bacterium]
MREIVQSTAFRKDVKRTSKRGKDMAKLRAVILLLIENAPLEPRHRDHPLKGEWFGYRDLHVEPDWVLIYKAIETELFLARTGTHSDLFGE